MKLFSINRSDEADARLSLVTRFDVQDLAGESTYLRRWSLWLPFGWSLKLHCIERPDSDRCEHDHPWWFWRFVLSGGYWETAGDHQQFFRRPFSLSYCGPNFRHRITELPKGRAWTMLLCGRRARDWGFFTQGGWMFWRTFVSEAKNKRVMWCEDGSLARVGSPEKTTPDDSPDFPRVVDGARHRR